MMERLLVFRRSSFVRITNDQPRTTRAQGLPISTIIIAAIGLIVLVIMSVMVAQKVGVFGKGTREVSEQQCSAPNQVKPLGTDCELILGSFKNLGPNDICCKG